MDVRVTSVDGLSDGEKPLVVKYEVKGPIGSSTGKRLLIPANLFETNSKPHFPEAKRDLAVDMRYPSFVQDAVRFKLPASIAVESAPTPEKAQLQNSAAFNTSSMKAGNAITLYRNVTIGKTFFSPADYPELRIFYGKLEAKDQETLVLTRAQPASVSAAPTGN